MKIFSDKTSVFSVLCVIGVSLPGVISLAVCHIVDRGRQIQSNRVLICALWDNSSNENMKAFLWSLGVSL